MNKARVTKVEITSSENDLLDKQKPDFPSLELADVAFGCLADSLYRRGGYCVKTWFRITFDNGDTYNGRIDVTGSNRSLRQHVIDHVAFCSGGKRSSTARAADVPGLLKAMQIDPAYWKTFEDTHEFN